MPPSPEDQVVAYLREECNECELQGVLVEAMADYLLGTLAVKEVPKDLPGTVDEWKATAQEAFLEKHEKDLPAPLEARLKRWLAGRMAKGHGDAVAGSPPLKTFGGAGGATPGPMALIAAELGVTPGQVQDDFDECAISSHTRDKAFSDIKAQGMLPSRILALSVALETGRVHPPSEMVGMVYGCDPRASTLVKDMRKAKIPLLSKALEEKHLPTVVSHINGLLRDLAAHGKMHEAALLSGWFQEWSQMFQGEEKLAISYLGEFLRVYPGRGLPTAFDFSIMFRVQKALGAGGGKEVEELAKELKSLKGTVNNLQEQCASMKKKNEAASRAIENLQRGGGGKAVVCHICGKEGHIARNCPSKDKAKGGDDEE